jgi:hypothetical protein
VPWFLLTIIIGRENMGMVQSANSLGLTLKTFHVIGIAAADDFDSDIAVHAFIVGKVDF